MSHSSFSSDVEYDHKATTEVYQNVKLANLLGPVVVSTEPTAGY